MEKLRLFIIKSNILRNLARGKFIVFDGKGAKDRLILLPQSLSGALQAQLSLRRAWFDVDLEVDKVNVWLPNAHGGGSGQVFCPIMGLRIDAI